MIHLFKKNHLIFIYHIQFIFIYRDIQLVIDSDIQKIITYSYSHTHIIPYDDTARDRKRELAILAIQRLWRGFSGRMSADRRWLEAKATCIQAQVRGYFARQSVQVLAQEYYASSVKIQKIVRGNHVRSRYVVVVSTCVRRKICPKI